MNNKKKNLKKTISLLASILMFLVFNVVGGIANANTMSVTIDSVMYPIDDVNKTSFKINLSGIEQECILVSALYNADRLVTVKTTEVNSAENEYTVDFDAEVLKSSQTLKTVVWNGLETITPLSLMFENKISEIPTQPDETVIFNFSDEFLYRFGTTGASVPIDITYTVDGTETTITEDAVVIEAENKMGTAAADVTITDGKANMTLTGGGQVTLTAYPKNFADDESKKVKFTFEVLEGYYNLSSSDTSISNKNFCLVNDVKNVYIALYDNQSAYGNNYTVDNSNISVSADYVNGGFVYLYNNAKIDNFKIIGIYTDDFYLGTDETVAKETPGYTWSGVKIYEEGTVSNCHISYCKAGVKVYRGIGHVENVTVYNSIMPINIQGGTTLNLNGDIVIDQILLPEHSEHKLGAGIVAEAGSPATINVNGDVHFHSFMSEDDSDNMPSNAKSYVQAIFNDSSASFKFVKDEVEYVNPAFSATGSSAENVQLNVSENSNFYNKYSQYKKTILTETGIVWSYDNTKTTTEELTYLWEKPEYKLTAGFEQVKPLAYNIVEEVSSKVENGVATYDFSSVYFRKYDTNLSYSVSASVGTINGTTLSINATEDTTSILTYTVTDNFANKTYTYQTSVHATVPEYAPTIVFAAPSGINPGSSSETAFEYKGRDSGNLFDPDFDIDLDASYGFAAFDYKGNQIDIDNNATSGARVTVDAVVTEGIQTKAITTLATGYFSTISGDVIENADFFITRCNMELSAAEVAYKKVANFSENS